LRSFRDVGLHLTGDFDIDRLLEVIVDHAIELTGSSFGAAAILDAGGSIARVVNGRGENDAPGSSPPLPDEPLWRRVAAERNPIRWADVADRDQSLFLGNDGALDAALGASLRHRGAVVGALCLMKTPGLPPFSEADEAIVTVLGATAAAAIENARLFTSEAERAGRTALLQEIAWKVRHSLDITDVLTDSVEVVGKAAGVDRCFVRLVEAPGSVRLGPIEVEWDAHGIEPLEPSRHSVSPVASVAARTRETEWTEDVTIDPRYQGPEVAEGIEAMRRAGARAALSTPLAWGDELIGVMSFHSLVPRRWTDAERALIEAAAREVSVALHHARLYYEALDQAEKLTQLDRLRSDFLSMVSHELRSPMTVVSGIAHILKWRGDKLGADSRDELLDTLERESRRLTRLVSEFLDMDAIERGHIDLQRQDVDVADLAAEAMVDGGQAQRTALHVEGHDTIVVADRDRIKQVLLNLLGNAAKFSDDGAPIDVTIKCHDEHVVIDVRDRGPGIAPEDLDRLFERFTRLSTTVHRTAGSGIGLYVSKHIVDLHNGEITVTSEVGHGATFSVRLPRRP
jgi:signal transduction histidine kinase